MLVSERVAMHEAAPVLPVTDHARLFQRRIYRYGIASLGVAALVLLWMGRYTDLDLRIEDYYFNWQTHAFPWRESAFAYRFAHVWMKQLLLDIGLLLLAVTLFDLVYRQARISDFVRQRIRFVVVSSLLVPASIRTLKHFSAQHCPWDVDRYGGFAPFVRLLDHMPEQVLPGHCFPAGHASTGLWLAAFAVFWLPHAPRTALQVFLAGLGVGLFLGWAQQMRGAHFLSHTLWAIWVASAVMLLLFAVFSRQLRFGPASTSPRSIR